MTWKCGGLTFRAKRKEPWPTAERKEHLSRLFPTALSTSLWSIGNLRQQLISFSCRLLSFIFCLQQRLFNYTFYSISIFLKHVADQLTTSIREKGFWPSQTKPKVNKSMDMGSESIGSSHLTFIHNFSRGSSKKWPNSNRGGASGTHGHANTTSATAPPPKSIEPLEDAETARMMHDRMLFLLANLTVRFCRLDMGKKIQETMMGN